MDVLQRRTVIQLSGVIAVGGLVAACSSSTSSEATTAAATGGGDAAATAAAPASSAAADGGGGGGGNAVATTADIPVGGGLVLAGESVVITQPADGEFKAFTAVCTHQGCIVDNVSNGGINCPCHGSKFDISTGEPLNGPATRALSEVPITVDGGNIVIA